MPAIYSTVFFQIEKMVTKGGKKRALSPAKEGEAATIEEVPLTRLVKDLLKSSFQKFCKRGSEDEPPKKLIKWTNKTRVLVLAARGLSFRYHLNSTRVPNFLPHIPQL